MKTIIVYRQNSGHDYRIQHLLCSMKLNNNVMLTANIHDADRADILLVEFNDSINFDSDTINILIAYTGKLVLYSVDDGCSGCLDKFPVELQAKIDGWISHFRLPTLAGNILNKIVMIPRWTIPYIDTSDIQYDSKINEIVFIGRTTGNYWLNGKNWRIESLDKIYNNQFLREHFNGWIVDDNIIDVSYQDAAYNKNFKFVKKNNFMPEQDWVNKLKSHTLSLCIPGHTKFGYRHPQSMATMATMVGNFDLTGDPYPFMFSDKMVDMSYSISPDLSDFESKLEESLNNINKTRSYALAAFDFYKTYYEVMPNNTYQPYIWKLIVENFNNLNIDIV